MREPLGVLVGTAGWRPMEVSAGPLRDRGGNLLGAMMTIRAADREPAPEERLLNYASDLEMLSEVSRMLSELSDPDEAAIAICTAAIGATGAITVLLWELTDDGLQICHDEGALAAEELADLIERARRGAQRTLSDASAVVERLAGGGDGQEGLVVGTAWHEPLASGGVLTGVLSILWPGLLADLERPGLLIAQLAHHAATALERSQLLRRLNEAARTDPLTGLANRRVWQETLDHEMARARREKRSLSIVLIDIDRFKAYNDSFGHPDGDRLLRDAAQAWSGELRTNDRLARVGGEEFAVILPSCPTEGACVVAERLRAAMPDAQTCSLGIVTWDGLASASEFYAAADAALYRAKHGGRNRYEVGQLTEHEIAA